jgi:hypothetical protein
MAGAKFRILHFTRSFGSATHSVGSTLRVWAWVGEGQGVGVGGTIQQKGDNFWLLQVKHSCGGLLAKLGTAQKQKLCVGC